MVQGWRRVNFELTWSANFILHVRTQSTKCNRCSFIFSQRKEILIKVSFFFFFFFFFFFSYIFFFYFFFFFFFFFFCRKGTRGLSLKQGSIYLFEALSWKVIPLQVCFMWVWIYGWKHVCRPANFPLHKKWSLPLRISSVNCSGFGHIYWRNS